ncbi:hypothetical protein LX32DRAFT_646456 [Colletotrichum zoysiae]|uniref:Uncharacterized protein n=1 Tax=Colletotrichum zoysiae TaxID=1216348 RepID=A0AAD9H4M9_9PEZI|nr:hypothetical protein LX32DRAFT_646456 [Colletotrichum zoysiae]
MSGINSMKNYVIDDELLEETAEKSVAKFEEVLEDWKKEVIGLLQRKEEGLNWSQRTKELETTLAGVVEKNTVETVNGPLNQLTQSIDECRGAIDALDMMNKVHQHNYDIKDSEIEALRAEISRLVKENQPGAAAVEALRLERDKASNEAKTAATEAETLRQKLGALEEERSKWKATAMKSHSAVSTKLVETLGKMQSGLRKDFQDGKALMKAAKQFDTDATTRVETTIKALMEKNLQAERERHEELLRAIKDNAVEQKEASRRGQRSYSAGMSDREVFDEILKSPWAGPTTRTIRNLAKFDVAHNNGSRESLSHSVVYHNIVPYMSSRGCTQAFEAFLEYSQPGNEYCLFAVLEKKNGEAAGAIRSGSRHCSDHKDREDCLVARCQAAADGQGKTYIVLNPETS